MRWNRRNPSQALSLSCPNNPDIERKRMYGGRGYLAVHVHTHPQCVDAYPSTADLRHLSGERRANEKLFEEDDALQDHSAIPNPLSLIAAATPTERSMHRLLILQERTEYPLPETTDFKDLGEKFRKIMAYERDRRREDRWLRRPRNAIQEVRRHYNALFVFYDCRLRRIVLKKRGRWKTLCEPPQASV